MRQPDPTSKPWSVAVAPRVLAGLESVARQHVDYVDMWPWLKVQLEDRIEAGRQKYGVLLETHNGRDALVDAWQEAADLVQYLTQAWLEANTAGLDFILSDARTLLLKLSRALWEQEQEQETDRAARAAAHYDHIDRELKSLSADTRAEETAYLLNQPVPPEVEKRMRVRQITTEIDEWAGWRGASEPE